MYTRIIGKLLLGSEFQDSLWGSSHLKSAKSSAGIFVEISAISPSLCTE